MPGNSLNIKDCSLLKPHHGLTGKHTAIRYNPCNTPFHVILHQTINKILMN